MATPAFLASTFRYLSVAGVTDWAVFIAGSLNTELLAAGWTSMGGGVYKSPVDAAGRWFDVLFVATTATRLQFRVRNDSGVTICDREIQIDAGGTEVRIYSGSHHLVIDSWRATPETAIAGLIDESPDIQTAHPNYTFGCGFRTTAGTNDNLGAQWTDFFALDSGVAAAVERAIGDIAGSGGTPLAITPTGAYIFKPCEMMATMGGGLVQIGRAYQCYVGDSTLALGAEVTVPIDVGTSAVFKVLGRAADIGRVLLCRKS